eukprot:scaffold56422_cov40-Phaeocystis_antarctica.AAC.1
MVSMVSMVSTVSLASLLAGSGAAALSAACAHAAPARAASALAALADLAASSRCAATDPGLGLGLATFATRAHAALGFYSRRATVDGRHGHATKRQRPESGMCGAVGVGRVVLSVGILALRRRGQRILAAMVVAVGRGHKVGRQRVRAPEHYRRRRVRAPHEGVPAATVVDQRGRVPVERDELLAAGPLASPAALAARRTRADTTRSGPQLEGAPLSVPGRAVGAGRAPPKR